MTSRRIALAVLVLVAILVGLAGFYLREPPAPADSIERSPAYQNEALLARAWVLPVARLYGPQGYLFQQNQSVCGPTSELSTVARSDEQAFRRAELDRLLQSRKEGTAGGRGAVGLGRDAWADTTMPHGSLDAQRAVDLPSSSVSRSAPATGEGRERAKGARRLRGRPLNVDSGPPPSVDPDVFLIPPVECSLDRTALHSGTFHAVNCTQ